MWAVAILLGASLAVASQPTPKEQVPTPGSSTQAAGEQDRTYLIEVERFHGRIGNNLAQLGHVLFFANLSGAGRVAFQAAKLREEPSKLEAQNRVELLRLVDLPDGLRLHGREARSGVVVPESCASKVPPLRRSDGSYVDTWYGTPCTGVTAREYHRVMQAYIRPLFTKELAACLAADKPPAEEDLLTIHLRGDDVWPWRAEALDSPASPRAWLLPPCSMYEKIIADGGFSRVLLVTSPDRRNPCVQWLQSAAHSLSVPIQVQSGSVLEDVCALLRATHLVLSYSSFAHNLAVLSDQVRRIYTRGVFDPHWLMDCDVWAGVRVLKYDVAVSHLQLGPHNGTYRGALHWMLTHPAGDVGGPTRCRRKQCRGRGEHGALLCPPPQARSEL